MGFLHDYINIRHDLPKVRCINEWIPIGVGRLAARIWLPAEDEGPLPALLEYLPYAKMTAWRDSIRHTYLAAHGYASVRVDMRGSGDSDGVLLDEYTQDELDDCLQVLAWLEAQPWCTGSCGMFGKSWGGFNALQVAALRPPQLKAIITIASTDDRYSDDVHYMGGCLLASEMLSWASTMLLYNALPPDPEVVGDRWKDMWLQRARAAPPLVHTWLSHPRRDSYWKHGSVCEDYGAIVCPVYVVGSYEDGYTNAVPRLMERLSAPRKGLIGPWAHNFPEDSAPGPAVGFLQESVRWWDHWLKGKDNGIMDGPALISYVLDGGAQDEQSDHGGCPSVAPGRWVADESWPSQNVLVQSMELVCEGAATKQTPQACGVEAPKWLRFGEPSTATPLQDWDNQNSILFFSPSLSDSHDILGVPAVRIRCAVDRPIASLAVRLCDVSPRGHARLVSWGIKNLNHDARAAGSCGQEAAANHGRHEVASEIVTGEHLVVEVSLKMSGYRIKRGHRWCVAMSTTYWPHIWPSPEPVTLAVSSTTLLLPIRSPSTSDVGASSYWQAPECALPLDVRVLREGSCIRKQEKDGANTWRLLQSDDTGEMMLPCGMIMSEQAHDTFEIANEDPFSAKTSSTRAKCFIRGGWRVKIATHSEMHSDAQNFHVANTLQCWQGTERRHVELQEGSIQEQEEELVLDLEWYESIRRDLQ